MVISSGHSCRDGAALRRLADSAKMWRMLKKIAEAELSESANHATDSVNLCFLSLAPRVARLNEAVHVGLMNSRFADSVDAHDSAEDAAAEVPASCHEFGHRAAR